MSRFDYILAAMNEFQRQEFVAVKTPKIAAPQQGVFGIA